MSDTETTADRLEPSSRVRPRTDLAAVELDGEIVLYDEPHGTLHTLNPTATIVWRCLGDDVSLDELADDLADAFGADRETVSRDVVTLVQQLGREGLLVGVAPDPEALDAARLHNHHHHGEGDDAGC